MRIATTKVFQKAKHLWLHWGLTDMGVVVTLLMFPIRYQVYKYRYSEIGFLLTFTAVASRRAI